MIIIKVWTKDYEWKVEGEFSNNGGYIKGISNGITYYTVKTELSLEEVAKSVNKEGYIICDGDNVIFSNEIFKISL